MRSIRGAVRLLSAVAVLNSQACILQPYDHQVVMEDEAVPVTGFSQNPRSRISVQLFNGSTGVFEEAASAVSGATPAYAAGYFSTNSPALYLWTTSVVVGAPGPRWIWNGYGSDAWLRVIDSSASNVVLMGGDLESFNCFFTENTSTSDFFSVVSACGWDNQVTHLGVLSNMPIP